MDNTKMYGDVKKEKQEGTHEMTKVSIHAWSLY